MQITFIFLGIILFLSAIEITLILKQKNKSIRDSILAVGIFGTFFGIYLGLQHFNSSPNEIDQSVIALIENLKIAFVTSLFGMGASIALSLFAKVYLVIEDNENIEIIRQLGFLEKIHIVLDENKKNMNQLNEIKTLLTTLNNQIVTFTPINIQPIEKEVKKLNQKIGNIESIHELIQNSNKSMMKTNQEISDTLKQQFKQFEKQITAVENHFSQNIQTLFTQFNDALKAHFNGFESQIDQVSQSFNKDILMLSNEIEILFEKMDNTLTMTLDQLSEKSSNEIAQVLKHSIEQFNTGLFAGFGENFRALNQASEKMLVWQNNYKETIEANEKSLTKSISAIENFEQLLSKHDSIFSIYQKLEEIIKAFDIQTRGLSECLKDYKIIGNEAKKTNPEIREFLGLLQQNIQMVDQQMTKTTQRFGNEYQLYIDALYKLLKTVK